MIATIPEILPRHQRARQGNPEITEWCPTCREQVIPMRQGLCGWCDTPVTAEAKAAARSAAGDVRERQRPSKERIVAWLAEHGPATIRTISTELNRSYRTTTKHVAELAAAGVLERIKNPEDTRCWLYTVRGA